MHMGDALISPAVGAVMLAASGSQMAVSANRLRKDFDGKLLPLMGVGGAFVFAAQMLNFAIPGTGSSGHVTGVLLLCCLLGPHAAYLTTGAILLVQALFFADGGLMAFGCNWINIGFYCCFIGYPLYQMICRQSKGKLCVMLASCAAAIAAGQLGSVSVVLETLFSGRTELPLGTFALFMQPIHLAISMIEGLATGAMLIFLQSSRPELLEREQQIPVKRTLLLLGLAAVLLPAAAIFASSLPDGLEWSLLHTAGKLFETDSVPLIDRGTVVTGIVGGSITLAATVLIGLAIRASRKRNDV